MPPEDFWNGKRSIERGLKMFEGAVSRGEAVPDLASPKHDAQRFWFFMRIAVPLKASKKWVTSQPEFACVSITWCTHSRFDFFRNQINNFWDGWESLHDYGHVHSADH